MLSIVVYHRILENTRCFLKVLKALRLIFFVFIVSQDRAKAFGALFSKKGLTNEVCHAIIIAEYANTICVRT
jgi:hypothetical protein